MHDNTEALIEQLTSRSFPEQHAATKALGAIGEAVVPRLIAALEDERPAVRVGAARALGLTRSPAAVQPLLRIAASPEPRFWKAACAALGKIGSPVVPFLLPSLQDPDPKVRTRAAYALALAGVNDPRLVEPMLAALGDEEYWVRCNATMVLHRRLKPPPLEGLLVRLQGGGPGPINDHAREHAAEALARLGDPGSFRALIAALRDPSPRVRAWAAQGLGWWCVREAIEPLMAAVAAPDPSAAAAWALGRLGDLRAVPLVIDVLERRSEHRLRAGAAEELGLLGDRRALGPLLRALGSSKPFVSSAAATALGRMEALEAVPDLLELLADNDPWRRPAVIEALGRIGDGRAIEPLRKLLHDEKPGTRESAAKALGLIGYIQPGPPREIILKDGSRARWYSANVRSVMDALGVAREQPPAAARGRDNTSEAGNDTR